MDAFRNFNQLGGDGVDAIKAAANEKLDALTNIHTRAANIAKAAGKMKLMAGATSLGQKIGKAISATGKTSGDEDLVGRAISAVGSKVQQAGSAVSSFVKDPLADETEAAKDAWGGEDVVEGGMGGAEEGFVAKGGSAVARGAVGAADEGEARLNPATMEVENKVATTVGSDAAAAATTVGSDAAAAATTVAGAASTVAATVGSDAAKVAEIAAKKAAALAAEVGEGGAVFDAIPFGDIASIAIGGVTAIIAAHKAKVAEAAQKAETSPGVTTSESFQAGIGTDE